MCQKSKCNNCKNCPAQKEDNNVVKLSWQQEYNHEALRLELNTLCEDITLYKQQDGHLINDDVLVEMEQRLFDTYNHAVKVGVTYELNDL